MKNPELMTENGSPENLSILFTKDNCTVIAIQDATEESITGAELAEKLNKLRLLSKFYLDRETVDYARLVTVDCFGVTHYFKAWK